MRPTRTVFEWFVYLRAKNVHTVKQKKHIKPPCFVIFRNSQNIQNTLLMFVLLSGQRGEKPNLKSRVAHRNWPTLESADCWSKTGTRQSANLSFLFWQICVAIYPLSKFKTTLKTFLFAQAFCCTINYLSLHKQTCPVNLSDRKSVV